MVEPIISVSGLRGIVGSSLTPEVAVRYVAAFERGLAPGPVVVARDGRRSGMMLAWAVEAALAAAGRQVLDAGAAATPTVGVLVRHHRAAGAVQITASHNPPEYNGLKLMAAEGRVIPAGPGERVLERYRQGVACWAPHDRLGAIEPLAETTAAHLDLLLATVDAPRLRSCGFSVLLDANHGAGGLLGRRLLEALGCRVTLLGETPDGRFEHPAEPTAENLQSVLAEVPKGGAAVGFCQDPDADRLAVVDEKGRYLGEEYTLALCLDHVLRHRQGAVVTNCATSRINEDLAERFGRPFFRAAVGEANVVDAMLAQDACFGGEGNGGPIDPRVGMIRDSFVGMAQILDAMAARRLPVSALAAELPRYEIVKTKIALVSEKVPAGLKALQQHFAAARSDWLDGLRLDWPDRWLLVRASNTEPIVRAIAEAATADEARNLCDQAAAVLAEA